MRLQNPFGVLQYVHRKVGMPGQLAPTTVTASEQTLVASDVLLHLVAECGDLLQMN